MKKYVVLSLFILVICVMTACNDEKSESQLEPSSENEQVEKSKSPLSEFDCYFAKFDSECIQYEYKEKEKLMSFLEAIATQNVAKNLNGIELQTRFTSGGFNGTSISTGYWTTNTGEVMYEVQHDMELFIDDKKQRKIILNFIEITDYQNQKKLFLTN